MHIGNGSSVMVMRQPKRGMVVALLVVLGATEATLRWGVGLGEPPLAKLDDAVEYELVRDAVYSRWGNQIEINTFGLRAPPVSMPKPAREHRVLLVGDSVIYGGHFLDQDETIAWYMTTELSARMACPVTVLPVAVSSWGPVNQQAFLAREGMFGASVAGVVLSGHDIADVPTEGVGMLPYRTRAPLTAIEDALTAVLERVFPKQPETLLGYEERVTLSLRALDDMQAAFRAAGVRMVLFYHPTIPERENGLWEAAEMFRAWAAARAVRFVDLSAVDVSASMYDDHIHPNAAGAAKLATEITGFLEPEIPACPP